MSERAATLHASPWQGAIYLTGGGSGLLAELLGEPGASRTLLDARIPYAAKALAELIGYPPEQACSERTARAMAMAAYLRALELESPAPFGLGCTASLATDRQKKGVHRAHAAVQTQEGTFTAYFEFAADRRAEELALVDALWHALFAALGLGPQNRETFTRAHRADEAWQRLLTGTLAAHPTTDHDGRLLLPGAFNPLHTGHRSMLAIAEARTGLTGAYELSVANVDKPPLDYLEIAERLAQFDRPVWLTRLPTFVEKALTFPGAVFVVGVDTLIRIAEPRYYGSERAMQEAFAVFADRDIRFLVFGRELGGRFTVLGDLHALPDLLHERSIGIGEREFRNPLSSTALRRD